VVPFAHDLEKLKLEVTLAAIIQFFIDHTLDRGQGCFARMTADSGPTFDRESKADRAAT
jgi:hypothetical protein